MKNISLLNQMLEERYLNCQKHPSSELYIYNYSAKAQYDRLWNEVTLGCRGLILDGEGNVIARPFPKFFNLGEYEGQKVPKSTFEVYEKMDGSLGISYVMDGKIQIATRGSFISDQSVKANELLKSRYYDSVAKMKMGVTYLFEIIYPENRIVVDYGDEKKLVLLAMIDIETGLDLPLEDIGFPLVKGYDGVNDINALKLLEEENKEGFVIKYPDGYRLKVKFEEYVRLHKIITQVSSISIWEYLKTNQSMDEILEQVPDEFYNWIKEKKNEMETQYETIEQIAKSQMKLFDTRKETAAYIMTCGYPKVMFDMMDKRDYSRSIWKMLRPIYERPFDKVEHY
jgi:T4 RnlA family RNA ligase